MVFRDWYPSKQTTELAVGTIAEWLRESSFPDFFLGWFVLCFHVGGGLFLVFWLLFASINSLYILCIFIWLLVIISNTYFHGCILSRLERHLFHSNTWHGPVSLGNLFFQLFFTEVTKDISNLVIKYCFAIPVSLIILLRLVSHGSYISALLLGLCFSAFAFSASQQQITELLFDALDSFEAKFELAHLEVE